MDTSSTSVTVDVAPNNDIDYVILENGESNQEMVKYQAKAGLVLSSMLRGLSLTALTDTEVAGNKKTHAVNSSIQITDVHYLLNDKVSNAAEETIAGLKTFTLAPKASAAATQTTELMRWDETCRLSDDQTVAGIKTFTSIPVLPASSPTTDNQAARKKYIDDLIAALSVPNIIDSHAVYTPAYLTGGGSAESNVAIWDSVSDGSFRITIDGVAYNVDGIDFTAAHGDGIVTDMDGVAARIQTYIRALTASTETCVWSTDHFIITSVDTTVATEVSVTDTSTGTVGTDISGVGTVYMDSETGRGTATAGVLDPTADSGKLVKMGSDGNIAQEFLVNAGLSGMISIYAGSSAPTGWLLCDGTTGKDSVADPTLANLYAVIGTTYGGTGADDFDLPDLRERVPVGLKAGGTFTPLGDTGGEETHVLTDAEMPSHDHQSVNGVTTNGVGGGGAGNVAGGGVTAGEKRTSVAGSDTAHNNLQPYIVLNYIIKK